MFEFIEHFIYVALAVVVPSIIAFVWLFYQLWDWMMPDDEEQ